MSRVRSARGETVNFELIAIKQQLASAPVPVGVKDRRRFIDEKDGIRVKQVHGAVSQPAQVSDALALGIQAAAESARAKTKKSRNEE